MGKRKSSEKDSSGWRTRTTVRSAGQYQTDRCHKKLLSVGRLDGTVCCAAVIQISQSQQVCQCGDRSR